MKVELLKWIRKNLEEEKISKIDFQTLVEYDEKVFALILSSEREKKLPLLKFFASKEEENPVYKLYQENPLKIMKLGELIQYAKGKQHNIVTLQSLLISLHGELKTWTLCSFAFHGD